MTATSPKAILLSLFLLLLFGGGLFLFIERDVFDNVATSQCSESIGREFTSPDKEYIATLFVRNCGATQGYITHVNLRKEVEPTKVELSGIVSAGEILSTRGLPMIDVVWRDNIHLELKNPNNDAFDILVDTERWGPVWINLDGQNVGAR